MKAIVTGAGKGIGKAISVKLFELGYDLILISRGTENLEQSKKEMLRNHPKSKSTISLYSIDLSQSDHLSALGAELEALSPDVLVNNVGTYVVDSSTNMQAEDFWDLMQLNFLSAVNLTQTVLPGMTKKQNGLIINICSVAAVEPKMDAVSYSISKTSLKVWAEALYEEVKKDNIKVSNIFPGAVATPSWDGTGADTEKMIQVQDIANAVEYLIKLSTYTNCSEIHLSPSI